MNSYMVNSDNREKLWVEGNNLQEAVDTNFNRIAVHIGAGGEFGVHYDSAIIKWEDGILGGKGGGVITITYHGSDSVLGYDPTNDPIKTASAWITCDKSELLKPIEIELRPPERKKDETPFDEIADSSCAFGWALAIIDQLTEKYCMIDGLPATNVVTEHYPSLKFSKPNLYLERARQIMMQRRPKSTAAARRLLDRLDELVVYLAENGMPKEEDCSYIVHNASAHCYFRAENKITALAYYRKKAGLTGQQLADKAGISLRQLRNYERTRGGTLGDAKYSFIVSLSKILGVSPDDLVCSNLSVLIDPGTGEKTE